MLSTLLAEIDSKLVMLLTGNVSLAVVAPWLEHIHSIATALVPVGQFLVAMATFAYIVKKTMLLRKHGKKLSKPDSDPTPDV